MPHVGDIVIHQDSTGVIRAVAGPDGCYVTWTAGALASHPGKRLNDSRLFASDDLQITVAVAHVVSAVTVLNREVLNGWLFRYGLVLHQLLAPADCCRECGRE